MKKRLLLTLIVLISLVTCSYGTSVSKYILTDNHAIIYQLNYKNLHFNNAIDGNRVDFSLGSGSNYRKRVIEISVPRYDNWKEGDIETYRLEVTNKNSQHNCYATSITPAEGFNSAYSLTDTIRMRITCDLAHDIDNIGDINFDYKLYEQFNKGITGKEEPEFVFYENSYILDMASHYQSPGCADPGLIIKTADYIKIKNTYGTAATHFNADKDPNVEQLIYNWFVENHPNPSIYTYAGINEYLKSFDITTIAKLDSKIGQIPGMNIEIDGDYYKVSIDNKFTSYAMTYEQSLDQVLYRKLYLIDSSLTPTEQNAMFLWYIDKYLGYAVGSAKYQTVSDYLSETSPSSIVDLAADINAITVENGYLKVYTNDNLYNELKIALINMNNLKGPITEASNIPAARVYIRSVLEDLLHVNQTDIATTVSEYVALNSAGIFANKDAIEGYYYVYINSDIFNQSDYYHKNILIRSYKRDVLKDEFYYKVYELEKGTILNLDYTGLYSDDATAYGKMYNLLYAASGMYNTSSPGTPLPSNNFIVIDEDENQVNTFTEPGVYTSNIGQVIITKDSNDNINMRIEFASSLISFDSLDIEEPTEPSELESEEENEEEPEDPSESEEKSEKEPEDPLGSQEEPIGPSEIEAEKNNNGEIEEEKGETSEEEEEDEPIIVPPELPIQSSTPVIPETPIEPSVEPVNGSVSQETEEQDEEIQEDEEPEIEESDEELDEEDFEEESEEEETDTSLEDDEDLESSL